jgi:hypothetical protein
MRRLVHTAGIAGVAALIVAAGLPAMAHAALNPDTTSV